MAVKQISTKTSWCKDSSLPAHFYSIYNEHNDKEHYASTVTNENTRKRLEYCHLITHPKTKEDWLKSGANEFYQLFRCSKPENNKQQVEVGIKSGIRIVVAA